MARLQPPALFGNRLESAATPSNLISRAVTLTVAIATASSPTAARYASNCGCDGRSEYQSPGGRAAALVVEDRKAAAGELVEPVDAHVELRTRELQRALELRLAHREGRPRRSRSHSARMRRARSPAFAPLRTRASALPGSGPSFRSPPRRRISRSARRGSRADWPCKAAELRSTPHSFSSAACRSMPRRSGGTPGSGASSGELPSRSSA